MFKKCKSGVNGSSVGSRRKFRSDLRGNVMSVKGQSEQPVGVLLLLLLKCWSSKVKPHASLQFLKLKMALCQA